MMNDYDEQNEYFYTLQRLGEEGITRACVNAMAAILTSSFKPKEITLVSVHKGTFDSVLFVIWGWLDPCTLTIVPDGFGTHGGEGGAGLSSVLGLIRYYKIPLSHATMRDLKMFTNFVQANDVDDTMLDILKRAKPYNWNYYEPDTVRKVKRGEFTHLEVDYWKFPVIG